MHIDNSPLLYRIARVTKDHPPRVVSVVMGQGFTKEAQKYAHCLEIPVITGTEKTPVSARDKKPKCILVSARDAFDQREWLYSLRKAASSQWYKNKECAFLQKKRDGEAVVEEHHSPREAAQQQGEEPAPEGLNRFKSLTLRGKKHLDDDSDSRGGSSADTLTV